MAEIDREIRQRQRALATGALIRPPKNERELVLEEEANEAEVEMLVSRRHRLWALLSGDVTDSQRASTSYDIDSATRALEIAWAAKRRLQVSRRLFEGGLFV